MQPLLLLDGLLGRVLPDFCLESWINHSICHLCGKLCLESFHNLALVFQLWYPVVLLQECLELIHRHAKLRCLLEKCAKVSHQGLILLLFGNLGASLKSLICQRCLIILVLQLDEEVVWNLYRILFEYLLDFIGIWHHE